MRIREQRFGFSFHVKVLLIFITLQGCSGESPVAGEDDTDIAVDVVSDLTASDMSHSEDSTEPDEQERDLSLDLEEDIFIPGPDRGLDRSADLEQDLARDILAEPVRDVLDSSDEEGDTSVDVLLVDVWTTDWVEETDLYTEDGASSDTLDISPEPDLPPPPVCIDLPVIRINEVVSSNTTGIADDDGDTTDWIELYNAGEVPVNLESWGLSDDEDELFKWTFGEVIMAPGDFLLLLASGKGLEELGGFLSLHTLIDWGDEWSYRDGMVPGNWTTSEYDDSSWSTGPSGFGRADGDDATELTGQTIYIRKEFFLTEADISEADGLMLHMDYDDGFVAYINGEEIARMNVAGYPPSYDEYTTVDHEALLYQGLPPDPFIIEGGLDLLLEGTNVIAVEVHDATATSSDLTLIPFLSLGYDTVNLSAEPSLSLAVSSFNTNFKLSAEGEVLTLTEPDGCVIDQLDTGRLYGDVSIGLQPDGGDDLHYFMETTPGSPNVTESYPGFAPTPVFEPPGGIFPEGSVEVSISVETPGLQVYFTRGGAEPTMGSTVYEAPVSYSGSSAIPLRARTYQEGLWPSRIATATYILTDPAGEMPTVSIVTEPANLWSDPGIYENYWDRIEVPAHLEFWEPDGSLGFAHDIGLMIHGGASRDFDLKSLRIVMRSGYGAGEINYPVFPDEPVTEFKRLVFRNGGHDFLTAHLRDALINGLANQAGVDSMAYRPAMAYLNGQYWGIYNIRERPDEFNMGIYHDVDPDKIDLLEWDGNVVEGSNAHYLEMMSFLRTCDPTDPANWEYIQTQIDVNAFADYEIFQIQMGNYDWPGNNLKYWRPQSDDGRWRWIMYDTDAGLGNWGMSWSYDFVYFALDPSGPGWPNPPYSTELLRLMVGFPEFSQLFINRYADWLNTVLSPDASADLLNSYADVIRPGMTDHTNRWGSSLSSWESNVDALEDWIYYRENISFQDIAGYFGAGSTYDLTLIADPPEAGSFQLNAIEVASDFTGRYFRNNPVPVTAVPNPGYIFTGWSDGWGDEAEVTVSDLGGATLVANFDEMPGLNVVINEINYHSPDDFDPGDWIELINNGDELVDLAGWIFSDGDEDIYLLPEGSLLPSGGFIVIAQDPVAFSSLFPDVPAGSVVGGFDFSLSNSGENLEIWRTDGVLQDEVPYTDGVPWPFLADGGGPTLELIDSTLDNSQPINWRDSIVSYGTPGEANSVSP